MTYVSCICYYCTIIPEIERGERGRTKGRDVGREGEMEKERGGRKEGDGWRKRDRCREKEGGRE